MADPDRRRAARAWCLYDWANSAFATTVMAAMYPPFYRSLVLAAGGGEAAATAWWGYTTAAAVGLAALLGPVLGAVADAAGGRKRFLAGFAGLGIAATAAMALLGPKDHLLASALFVAANLGFSGSVVFYESLLPAVAGPGELDRVSTRGYAYGYLGGGLLLLVQVLWLMRPEWFLLGSEENAVRAAFASVALWWALFTVPLLTRVPEPPAAGLSSSRAAAAGLARLARTVRSLPRRRPLFLFLLGFWIYSEGIGTIIRMATAYGSEIGVDRADLVGALLLTQAVGVPAALLWGRAAGRVGPRPCILICLAGYVAISIAGYYLRTALHFYLLAAAVGLFQGGAQALSRSLFATMVPPGRSAEYFGLFGVSARFAGFLGPLAFGLVAQAAGGGRLAIAVVAAFFLVGGGLLARVDLAAGAAAARGEGEDGRSPGQGPIASSTALEKPSSGNGQDG